MMDDFEIALTLLLLPQSCSPWLNGDPDEYMNAALALALAHNIAIIATSIINIRGFHLYWEEKRQNVNGCPI